MAKRDFEHRFIIPPPHVGASVTHQCKDGTSEELRRKDAKELILQLLCSGHSMMPFVNRENIGGRKVEIVDVYCFKFDPSEIETTEDA